MRLAIAENMHASVTQAPHVTAVFEADFSAIIAHREAHKAAFAKKGVKRDQDDVAYLQLRRNLVRLLKLCACF